MRKYFLITLLTLSLLALAMAQNPQTFSTELLKQSFEALSADKAIGDPIQVGNVTVIPMFQLRGGFGGGTGGDGKALYGGGVGGAIDLLPYAVMIVSDHKVEVVPVMNTVPFFEQLMNALPKILPIVFQIMGMNMEGATGR